MRSWLLSIGYDLADLDSKAYCASAAKSKFNEALEYAGYSEHTSEHCFKQAWLLEQLS